MYRETLKTKISSLSLSSSVSVSLSHTLTHSLFPSLSLSNTHSQTHTCQQPHPPTHTRTHSHVNPALCKPRILLVTNSSPTPPSTHPHSSPFFVPNSSNARRRFLKHESLKHVHIYMSLLHMYRSLYINTDLFHTSDKVACPCLKTLFFFLVPLVPLPPPSPPPLFYHSVLRTQKHDPRCVYCLCVPLVVFVSFVCDCRCVFCLRLTFHVRLVRVSLQHVATHCNTLQHTATLCNMTLDMRYVCARIECCESKPTTRDCLTFK